MVINKLFHQKIVISLQFQPCFPYKLWEREQTFILNVGYNLEIPHLLTVFLSIPFDQLPCDQLRVKQDSLLVLLSFSIISPLTSHSTRFPMSKLLSKQPTVKFKAELLKIFMQTLQELIWPHLLQVSMFVTLAKFPQLPVK